MSIHADFDNYSAQKKKKVNTPEGAKYFFLLKGVYSFWHHCIMIAELPYRYNFVKKNCLTIKRKNLFAPPGPLLNFLFLSTVFLLSVGKFMYSI